MRETFTSSQDVPLDFNPGSSPHVPSEFNDCKGVNAELSTQEGLTCERDPSFGRAQDVGGDVVPINGYGVGGRNLHGHILYKLAEVLGLAGKIRFTVHFHQNTNFASGMDIGLDLSFRGGPSAPFLRRVY